jgi:hypothetical protein
MGQGGIWAFLLAESKDDIRSRFPELQIIDEKARLADCRREESATRAKMTVDINDTDHPFLAAVLSDRTSG